MFCSVENLNLRVNGIVSPKVTVRRAIEGGYPGGHSEIVLHDPVIGPFALTSDFLLETQENKGPWMPCSLTELRSKVVQMIKLQKKDWK